MPGRNHFSLMHIVTSLILLLALSGCLDLSQTPPPAWPGSVTAVIVTPESGTQGGKPTRTPRAKRTNTPAQDLITDTPTVVTETATDGGANSGGANSDGTPVITAPPDANFDFFVLALSWSPEYCATHAKEDPQQCSIERNPGFVLHGLWPQYTSGYPSNCSTQKMPASVKAKFPHLYPSDSLLMHEWAKHGTCSGLSPESYLTMSQQVKESVTIPADFAAPDKPFRVTLDQLRKDFAQANPGMDSADVTVACSGSGRFLEEVYVCFSKDGKPAACSKQMQREAQKSCARADFLVQSAQ